MRIDEYMKSTEKPVDLCKEIDALRSRNELLEQQLEEKTVDVANINRIITETNAAYEENCNELAQYHKENEALKNILLEVLSKNDCCNICEKKGQVLCQCNRMTDKECLENLIRLWELKD